MRTKQQILERIDAIVGVEQNKIFTAPSRFLPTNISLIQDKIEGLKALRDVISASSGHRKDIPAQDWLKKTIKEIVEKHPKLTEGFFSDTNQLLQAIAPGWEAFTPTPARFSSALKPLPSKFAGSSRSAFLSSPAYDYQFKIRLVGDRDVGKTSTRLQFCEKRFTGTISSAEYQVKQIDNIKLLIWDQVGQERYRALSSQYARGMSAAIVMFDITNQETFANVAKWLHEIDRFEPNMQLFIVGNKSDLTDERKVSSEDARDFAKQYSLPYIEISAKDGTNVDDLFKYVAECLKGRLEDGYFPATFEEYLNGTPVNDAPEDGEDQKPDGGGSCTIS